MVFTHFIICFLYFLFLCYFIIVIFVIVFTGLIIYFLYLFLLLLAWILLFHLYHMAGLYNQLLSLYISICHHKNIPCYMQYYLHWSSPTPFIFVLIINGVNTFIFSGIKYSILDNCSLLQFMCIFCFPKMFFLS